MKVCKNVKLASRCFYFQKPFKTRQSILGSDGIILFYFMVTAAILILNFWHQQSRIKDSGLISDLECGLRLANCSKEHFENIKQAFRGHSENSESNQTASHRQSLKYFVLFKNRIKPVSSRLSDNSNFKSKFFLKILY